ncbi:MAG: hypothetical protein R3327_07540 [Nitrosopumilaceae archaeon]|nr:hypothetical protein [Nitrosopumilaceae archaeon]
MVEIPQIKKNPTFDKIPWEDVRGLSWLITDEEELDSKVSTYACA